MGSLNNLHNQNRNRSSASIAQDGNESDCSNEAPTDNVAIYNDEKDVLSGAIDRPYSGVFEGPEKTLEVVFRPILDTSNPDPTTDTTASGSSSNMNKKTEKIGMRRLNRADLDRICLRARCTILSFVSNQFLDAYVLSESSLFVYPYSVVLKTCGTTTLLRCVSTLIELGKKVGLEIDWLGYSRKNFTFPWDQSFPHESFYQELEYLGSHRSLSQRLDGNGYTLGPVTGDHWFVFVADQTKRGIQPGADTDRVLNIMMFDIDPKIAKLFYYDQYEPKRDDETKDEAIRRISTEQMKKAGIDDLCPGYGIDSRAFEPCGYSMNAILFRSYTTMHITPEDGSSYASFETNRQVVSYTSLIHNVIRKFQPKRFVMTLMADDDGLKQMKQIPFTVSAAEAQVTVPFGKGKDVQNMVYKRSSVASIAVEDDCVCMMGNWTLQNPSVANPRQHKLRGYSVS